MQKHHLSTGRYRVVALQALLLLVIFASSPRRADAQWTAIRQFPTAVTTVYYLDKAGSATTGFTGLFDGEIWKTTDRGLTWSQMASLTGKINCLAFKDSLIGWCATNSGLFRTTNGGVSWSSALLGGTIYCVGYCTSSGVVCAVDLQYCHSSTDLGTTWKTINLGNPSLHISVEFSGVNGAINGVGGAPEFYTTDGGITWTIGGVSLKNECWALHAISTTDFFCVSELGYTVSESTDGGQSWSLVTPLTSIQPTGCILGGGSALFMQTTAGFLTSTDRGHTWFSICGPKNGGDTRFYAMGNEIWAGDWNGWMWYCRDASHLQPLNVTILPDSFHLDGKRCFFTDSTFRIQYSASCPPILEQAIVITGLESFSLRKLPLPRSVTGPDTLPIRYTPGPTLHDTGSIDLVFKIGETTFDTIVKLSGSGTAAASLTMAATLPLGKIAACSTRDTSFLLRNLSCDTITITSATFGDPAHFQLGSPTLPAKIPPYSAMPIHVLGSSNAAGSYQDILKLHLLSGLTISIDTQVALSLTVIQNSHIPWTPLSIALGGSCKSLDTVIAIPNLLCDSLLFAAIAISDSSYFHPTIPTLPFGIKGGDTLRIPIHINAGSVGSHAATVSFSYMLNGVKKDTTLALTSTVYQPNPSLALDSARIDFGRVGMGCEEGEQYIHFRNPLCDSIQLVSVLIAPPDSEYAFNTSILPLRLVSGAEDSILVHFSPIHAGIRATSLMLTFESNGVTHDTLIALSGAGFSTFRDTVLNAALAFDTVPECQTRTLTAELINSGCGDLIIESATVPALLEYGILGMTFPDTIRSQDTVAIRVAFTPKGTGASTDSIVLTLHTVGDTAMHAGTLLFLGFATMSSPEVDVRTPLSFLGIAPCQSLDTVISITNPSVCDTLFIQTCLFGGDTSLHVDPSQVLPIVIPPSGSTSISIRLTPPGGSSATASMRLQGPGLDTTLPLKYSALAGGEHWTLSNLNPRFIAKPCDISSQDVLLVNDGCDSITITKIALDAQSQFVIQDSLTFPLGLHVGSHKGFSVHFVPIGNGEDSVTLHITSLTGASNRVIELYGNSAPIPFSRFTLVAADGSNACTNTAGKSVQLSLVALDAIPDSLFLRTLSCHVVYDGGLLTFVRATAQGGWNVISASEQSPGVLNLKLSWSGGNLAPSSTIASLNFSVFVGDSTGTGIGLANLRLNDDDSSYDGCTVQSVESSQLQFTLIDDCASPLLRTDLDGKVIILSVVESASAGRARFHLSLPKPTHVLLDISNVLGLRVKSLCDEDRAAGLYILDWDGRDNGGEDVPAGMYYYRLLSSAGVERAGNVLIVR